MYQCLLGPGDNVNVDLSAARGCDEPELPGLEVGAESALEGTNRPLIPPVERPLPDAFRGDETGSSKRLEVSGGSRLGDPELVGDEDHADAIIDQVPVALRPEVGARVAEPFEDLETLWAGESAKDLDRVDRRRRRSHRVQIKSLHSRIAILLWDRGPSDGP